MGREFRCPVDDCEFTASRNGEDEVEAAARCHVRDNHGGMPTRDEVEGYLIGPG